MFRRFSSILQPVVDDDDDDEEDGGVFGTEDDDEMSGLQDALASQRCVETSNSILFHDDEAMHHVSPRINFVGGVAAEALMLFGAFCPAWTTTVS